ncbi:MAG: M23 family metallopeptidase [Sulfitobacter sp.]|nr:M23 family metallopeptidase [Sulfitobacter sp.]
MLAVALALTTSISAQAFTSFASVPGGISVVLLNNTAEDPPKAFFGDTEVLVARYDGRWLALVGLNWDTAPGFYAVMETSGENSVESSTFSVKSTSRPIHRIDLPKSQNPLDITPAYNTELTPTEQPSNTEQSPDLDFVLPVDRPIKQHYGWLNFHGTSYTLPYPGLGFDTNLPAAIVSPSFGQIVEIENTPSGTLLTMDHGGGLISVFRHLENIAISTEDWLPKGAVLGQIQAPKTRDLLPDWSVYLNGALVDPLLLVSRTVRLESTPAATLAPQ